MKFRVMTIGDICEFKYGKSLPARERDEGPVEVYGSNGPVGNHTAAVSDGETIVIGRKGSQGEVQYSRTSCYPIDTTYYIDKTCTRQHMRWLYYALKQARLPLLNRAAAVPGLNRNDAYERSVIVPPLPEQRRIAAILDKADAIRRKRREAIRLIDDFLRSVFLDMFGDPVTNPKGWKMVELGDLGSTQGGLQVTHRRSSNPIDVPYLRVANVLRGKLDLTEIKSIKTVPSEIERTSLTNGDLLIVEGHGNSEEIGRCAVWRDELPECVHQNHIIRVRPYHDKLLSDFACHYINSTGGKRQMTAAARTTSGLNTISTQKVRAFSIPLPHLDLQRRFSEIAQSIEKQKKTLFHHSTESEILFSSLQSRAFKGEM